MSARRPLIIAATRSTAPLQGTANLQLPCGRLCVAPYQRRCREAPKDSIVRFGNGGMLPKFQIRGTSTKIYIPMDGTDYAVVNAERQGEMPVCFKAKENGIYTLSLGCENVAFSYLHLIDNMTGNDVDLLQTPSYSFNAKTTDYESRFKLVFVCGDANDDNDFAFISNGNIIVNGEGTLQVIDMMGRVIFSGDAINRVSTSGMTLGVYVLRLINGNDVKTQKMVIE